MRVFSLKSCDTCRKALKELSAAGHAPQVVDISDGLARADVDRIVAAVGDAAVNRRSTTWRGLSEDERAMAPADLIMQHPTVMKRPVIEAAETHVGWTDQVRAAVL